MPSDPDIQRWDIVGPLHRLGLFVFFAGPGFLAVYALFPAGTALEVSWLARAVMLTIALVCLWALLLGGVVVNARERYVERWWGPGFAVVRRRIHFEEIDRVEWGLDSKPNYRRSAQGWYHLYVVSGQRRWRLSINTPASGIAAKRLAETIGCPMVNWDDEEE